MKAPRLLAAVAFLFTLGADLSARTASDSVVLLFAMQEDGSMRLRCTATAFASGPLGPKGVEERLFVTASHCVSQDHETLDKAPFYLSSDEASVKSFTRARVVAAGKHDEGYDFAILSAPLMVPIIPIGDENEFQVGDDVVNIAAPLGLGKVLFKGTIALLKIERPLVDIDSGINWTGYCIVQLPSEGGSSGSPIIAKGKIIALVVGHYRSLTIAIPASLFRDPPPVKFMLVDPRKP